MTTVAAGTRRLNPQTLGLWAIVLVALLIALRLLLVPDPGGKLLLLRAQRLEGAGMMDQALRQYALLATTHPDSPYAVQALRRQGDILTEKARAGDTARFQEAIAVYRSLADRYPQHTAAGEALLSIGALYMVDLNDTEHARSTYTEVLKSYPNNPEFASEATLRLGRVAFSARDGKSAQSWLQRVLQKYAAFSERCAEAQYLLGETYESLFKNREAARNAYEATVRNYAKSVWAGNARERLGLLLYADVAPRARRVMITVPATVPGPPAGSLTAALQTLLAARGLEVGEATLRGWSMEPFFAGIVPSEPGRAVSVPFQSWQNSAVNAGLRYSISSADAKTALTGLQQEIDGGRLPVLYTGSWRLVTGYDSQRNEVYLQAGGEHERLTTAALARVWERRSNLGGSFTMVSFHAPGEDDKARPAPANAGGGGPKAAPSAPGAAPPGVQVTQVTSPLATPTYVYELKTLSEKNAHRRALRQAAEWMKRTQSEGALINGEALRYLVAETRRLSEAPAVAGAEATGSALTDTPVRIENGESAAAPTPGATPAAGGDVAAGGAPGTGAPAAGAPAPGAERETSAETVERARALLAWKGAPLQQWLGARRAAAAWLDIAAARLKDNTLRQAAEALRTELTALENAAALLPAAAGLAGPNQGLSEAARKAFAAASAEFERARLAEAQAAELIAAAAG